MCFRSYFAALMAIFTIGSLAFAVTASVGARVSVTHAVSTSAAAPGTPAANAGPAPQAAAPTTAAVTAGDCTYISGVTTCNVREVAAGKASDISSVFSLPALVIAGYVILKEDPAKPNDDRSNWSDVLHFLNRGDGLSTTYQIVSSGCNKGPGNVICFPSYSTVIANNAGFITEVQYGAQNDSVDATVYQPAPNTYNIFSAARFADHATILSPANGFLSSSPLENPPHHRAYGGNWAADVASNGGGTVYAEFANPTGTPLALNVAGTFEPCASPNQGKAGIGVTVEVRAGGVLLGTVKYAHLLKSSLTHTSGSINNGDPLGVMVTTATGATKTKCWSGPHVHVEPANAAGVSCFQSTALNTPLTTASTLGILGKNSATGPNQTC